ncbi:uncharacterized protein LOC130622445 [Hydractinia symbiolongicarpus]|uniref:uncharacterized protein LOC130622445 n=1 Tax=Hydractinia symbiolongicarpus TaxID=13093 RepID=UPI0025504BFC|nr:uncharacterized protein LOC130622445 [Hydractinia symbiolongicarpus]
MPFSQKGVAAKKRCQECGEENAPAKKKCHKCQHIFTVKGDKPSGNKSCNLFRAKKKIKSVSADMARILNYDVLNIFASKKNGRTYVDVQPCAKFKAILLDPNTNKVNTHGKALLDFLKGIYSQHVTATTSAPKSAKNLVSQEEETDEEDLTNETPDFQETMDRNSDDDSDNDDRDGVGNAFNLFQPISVN